MKCRDCLYLSKPKTFQPGQYPSVRCSRGEWDHDGHEQWYSYGNCQLNRAVVRSLGAACVKGKEEKASRRKKGNV